MAAVEMDLMLIDLLESSKAIEPCPMGNYGLKGSINVSSVCIRLGFS